MREIYTATKEGRKALEKVAEVFGSIESDCLGVLESESLSEEAECGMKSISHWAKGAREAVRSIVCDVYDEGKCGVLSFELGKLSYGLNWKGKVRREKAWFLSRGNGAGT